MVTAAKGAEHFYNYTEEDHQRSESESEKSNEGGLKVRKESP